MSDFDLDIKMNPHLPEPYNERGNKRLSIGDYRGALEDFIKAAEIDPNYSIHFYNCGVAKFYLKDFKGAIEEISKAVSLRPLNDGYFFNRGVAKCASGDIPGGIEDFSRAIELKSKYIEAHILRGNARGGFGNGCYNPLNDNELICIFQGNLESLKQKISEIEKAKLCRMINNN